MAKPSVIEARKARAMEEIAVQVEENRRRLALILKHFGISDASEEEQAKPAAEDQAEPETSDASEEEQAEPKAGKNRGKPKG